MTGTEAAKAVCKSQRAVDRIKSLFSLGTLIWISWNAWILLFNIWEKLFMTSANLQEELDKLQIEGEKMGQTDEHAPEPHPANIKVIEMSEKKLTLKIRKHTTSFSEEEEDVYNEEECPSSADIEVVHSRVAPSLHGILKQRSISESSEDHLSVSSGESPTGCSPRDSDSSGGKRFVTFNNHIDKTTYKSNGTVSSMKQALKSKRKRNRKREDKRRERDGRRRHNSNGSECSSCDDDVDMRQSSESQSEDDPKPAELALQFEETGVKVDDYGVIEEDQEESDGIVEAVETKAVETTVVETEENKHSECDISEQPGYQIHSELEKNSSKLAAQVKSKMAEKRSKTVDDDSDDDVCDEGDERTSECGEKKSVIMTSDENEQKEVNVTKSAGSESQGNNDLNVTGNGNDPIMAANRELGEVLLNGDTTRAIKGNNPGKGNEKKGAKVKKNVKEAWNENEKGDGDKTGDQKAEPLKNDVETDLSFRDVNDKNNPFNEHRTECAFTFSNDVMYDLDID